MDEHDRPHDDTPQPASGPMDKATAAWYTQHTNGQLQAAQGEDGRWYLYPCDPPTQATQPDTPPS